MQYSYEAVIEVPCDQRPNSYEYCVPPAAVGNDPNVMVSSCPSDCDPCSCCLPTNEKITNMAVLQPHQLLAILQGFGTGAAAGLRTVASALPARASPPPDTPIDLTVWAVDAVRADLQSVAAQSTQSMTAYKDVDAAQVRLGAACNPCLNELSDLYRAAFSYSARSWEKRFVPRFW